MRVAVVGVGGIGGSYAAYLSRRDDVELQFCVRQPFQRLVAHTVAGAPIADIAARVHTSPGEVTPVDWVLLATKGHQVAGAGQWLEALCDDTTAVAVLQNGVEHVERASPYINGADVLPVLVWVGGYVTAPGRIVNTSTGRTAVPDNPTGRRFAELFAGSGLPVELAPDFLSVAWTKLATNVAASPTTAVFNTVAPAVGQIRWIRELAAALVEECLAVGRTLGADLGPSLADELLDSLAGYPIEITSSMCRDRAAGREMEIDTLLGPVVRHGAAHGVPTPLTVQMVELLNSLAGFPRPS